jgi:hypothetical protein
VGGSVLLGPVIATQYWRPVAPQQPRDLASIHAPFEWNDSRARMVSTWPTSLRPLTERRVRTLAPSSIGRVCVVGSSALSILRLMRHRVIKTHGRRGRRPDHGEPGTRGGNRHPRFCPSEGRCDCREPPSWHPELRNRGRPAETQPLIIQELWRARRRPPFHTPFPITVIESRRQPAQ